METMQMLNDNMNATMRFFLCRLCDFSKGGGVMAKL